MNVNVLPPMVGKSLPNLHSAAAADDDDDDDAVLLVDGRTVTITMMMMKSAHRSPTFDE